MTTSSFVFKKFNYRNETINLLLFSLGKLISIFGTSIYTFAIGLYVLKITGSALSFAATMASGVIPKVIIYPFAGVLADRLDRKKLVVLMDLSNGALLIGLYLLSSAFGLNLPMILISTFIMTAFTSLFDISFEAAKPNIVSEKMLMNINSASRIIDSVSAILGPIVGGMIYAFMDIRFFIVINGISFIFSAISEMFIDFRFNVEQEEEYKPAVKVDIIKDMKEGFKHLIENKYLINIFSTFIALNFFLGFSVSVPLPFVVNNVLKLKSTDFGIIEGAFSAGIILGALCVSKIGEKLEYSKILMRTSCVTSILMVMIGLPTVATLPRFSEMVYLFYYCVIMGTFGMVIAFIDIPIAYIMQKSVSDEFRGRVLSIGISIDKSILPLALIMSGLMINLMPAYLITTTGGVLLLTFIIFSVRIQSSIKK